MAETVKTYPDLSAAAIKEGCDLSLRLWYILRQEIPDGRGWMCLKDVFELSPWRKRKTRRWLRDGDGLLWDLVEDRDGRKVRLRALNKLTPKLGAVTRKKTAFVPVGGNTQTWRANLLSSFFAGEDFVKISQAKLSEIFGRGAKTLYTWSRLAEGLEVRRNMGWDVYDERNLNDYPPGAMKAVGVKDVEEETDDSNYCWVEHWADLPDEKGKGWSYRKGGHKVICWFLPNSYRSDLQTGTVTTLQKRAKKVALETLDKGRGPFEGNFLKLFYEDAGAAARSFQEGREEPLFMADSVCHTWGKRWLWRFHTGREPAPPAERRDSIDSLVWTPRISAITGCIYYDTD